MKLYGVADEDTTAYDFLISLIDTDKTLYILLHARMPVDARPCKLPMSVTVQAVMEDSTVITVRQNAPGLKAIQV